MKYIKKVSASQLISNTGTIIDSMNPGDDQTVNAPSIHAVKDYVETGFITGEIVTVNGTTDSSGRIMVNVTNNYDGRPYVVSNISDALGLNYRVTVQSYGNNKCYLRYRNASDNSALANTAVQDQVLILGKIGS